MVKQGESNKLKMPHYPALLKGYRLSMTAQIIHVLTIANVAISFIFFTKFSSSLGSVGVVPFAVDNIFCH